MNKIFKYAMVALVASMGLTLSSCVKEYEYEAAGGNATSSGIYFSKDLPSVVDVSFEEDHFQVGVNRSNAAGELTIPVIITRSEGCIFTPADDKVVFADGEATAYLTFNYDPTKVEYGKYDDITIKIADEALASAYGLSSFTFKAGKTEWKLMDTSIGKASYRDDIMSGFFGIENEVWNVVIYESVATPGRYMIEDPYGVDAYKKSKFWSTEDEILDYYSLATGVTPNIIINAQDPNYVYTEEFELPFSSIFEFNMTIISWAQYRLDQGNSLESIKANNPEYFGKVEDNVIYMPANQLLWTMNGELWNYTNTNGLFAVALPGATIGDFSIEATYNGIFTNPAGNVFAVTEVKLGDDAVNTRAIVMEADADASAVADAIAEGELEAIEIVDGANNVPIPEDLSGQLQIIFVVMNGTSVKAVTSVPFEYYGGAGSPWTSLGTGYYTDDFIVPFATENEFGPYSYEVEIEEHAETPGLFRIKKAYASVAEAFGVTGGEKDIIIHAENPDAVYFLTQATGLDLGYGELSISSYGGDDIEYFGAKYNATVEQVIGAYPEDFGTLKDGVITLPAIPRYDDDDNPILEDGNPVCFQGYVYEGDYYYFAGNNCAFKLILPSASPEAKAKAKRIAIARKFEKRMHAFPHQGQRKHSRGKNGFVLMSRNKALPL